MITENQDRANTARIIAGLMMAAARTAPKGRGRDTLFIAMATEDEKVRIADHMRIIAEREQIAFFSRDAGNLLRSDALILIGTRIEPLGLKNCGYCGHKTCDGKKAFEEVPCSFNTIDLGIALGSAVSVAASHHADNRIMFSVGRAALELQMVPPDVKVLLGIPISISSKSIYFDRG
ncbi:MAG: ferredoxin [Bacteroidales bacterium]|nr:ferredoxin [Bacteroidales bacterium]